MKPALRYLASYVLGAVAFGALMLFAWFGIEPIKPYLYPNNDISWIKGLYDIKERRLRESSGPRTVLVGGSSVHFGLDAAAMSKALNRDVTNFGIHGGLGIPYMLDRVERNLRAGDTVILVFEHQLYQNRSAPNETSVFYTSFEDKRYWLRMPVSDWRSYFTQLDISTVWKAISENAENWRFAPLGNIPGRYKLANVDSFGVERGNRADAVTEAMRKLVLTDVPSLQRFAPAPSVVGSIDAFLAWARENGVMVIAAYPPMVDQPTARTDAAAQWFKAIENFWRERNVPVLGNPQDAFFPLDDSFDTAYHANERGAALVTARMIKRLQHLESRSVANSNRQ